MLFILGMAAVFASIIGFCMMMEKLDEKRGKHAATGTVIRYTDYHSVSDYHSNSDYYSDSDYQSDSDHGWDPLDPTDPYNDCPSCGSSNTDGNHCYDCDEDF